MAIIPQEEKVFMVSNSTNTTYSGSAALKAMQQWYTMQDVTDTVKPYKVYTALLSQTGTDAPVATVLENTIGDIVWTRIGVGNFRGTLASAFTLNKTIAFPEADIQQTPNMSVLTFGTIDENTVVIQSLNNLIIGDEFAGWIEIRVYN